MDPTPAPLLPPTEYLIRFVQVHETFRKPEIEALALIAGVNIKWIDYSESSPYSTVHLSPTPPPSSSPSPNPSTPTTPATLAHSLLTRSLSAKAIYEIWGTAPTWPALHADIPRRSAHLWPLYKHTPFKFAWDSYRSKGSRSMAEQRSVIDGFKYLGFEGEIRLGAGAGAGGRECWTIFEEFGMADDERGGTKGEGEGEGEGGGEGEGEGQGPTAAVVLKRVFLGRLLATSERETGVLSRYSLKKRKYINTTSMDAELAFLTANITLAAPEKLFLDPFVGTGGLPLACAHFGAACWGGDIDGRMVRGREDVGGGGGAGAGGGGGGEKRDVRTNFGQYGLRGLWMDGLVADLTNSPLRVREGGWLDGIVCDPPYGVREGLKVLGRKEGKGRGDGGEEKGREAYLKEGYVPPKRAYSLEAMLGDILVFAAGMLVDGGRVSLWMPTANDVDEELAVPLHPALELVSVCVQVFNKWSRRLLTYRRIPGVDVEQGGRGERREEGTTADELNAFRRRYFQGFRVVDQSPANEGLFTLSERDRDEKKLPGTAAVERDGQSFKEKELIKQRSTYNDDTEDQNKSL